MIEKKHMTSAGIAPSGRPLVSHRFSAILPVQPQFSNGTGKDLIAAIAECVRTSELTAVAEVSAGFDPYGLSAVVVLQESHVAVHCWPEIGKALIDVHICDYFSDNRKKAERLCALLAQTLSGQPSLCHWHYALIHETQPVNGTDFFGGN